NEQIKTLKNEKNKEQTRKDIDDSLDKLGLDKIDLYLIHNPMNIEDYKNRKRQGVLEALKGAKNEGLIENVGISCDYTEPLELAIQDDVDVIMTHYNVGNTLSERVIDKAYRKNIGIIAAKPFAGGILVDSGTEIEEGRKNNLTPEKSLNFVLSNKKISTALVGARYPWQIEECANTGKSFNCDKIKREKIKEEVFAFLGNNFCRDCRYCWPCEELGYDFNIPEILRFLDRYEKYNYKRFPRLGFSKLPYRDRITDFNECDVSCPFGVDIQKRLKDAQNKLSLKVTKSEWLGRINKFNFDDVESIRKDLEDMELEEIINYLHVNLIPNEKISEAFGMFLTEGFHSFGKKEVMRLLGEINDL
ncbi:MAG: aldo/keto reductase, partial [Candidatus Aenigmatarchaeota archaeon]